MKQEFPRQGKLIGLMRRYDITYEEMGNAIGMTASGVEAIANGRVDFRLSRAKKFIHYIEKKASKYEGQAVKFSLDEVME